mgnify:CR=1 FL=1
MGRMTRLKRERLDKEVSKSDDPQETKLKKLMDEDGMIAKVYQEVYSDVKMQAEAESDALKELHSKFDYYYDKEKMADKLPTHWYNLDKIDKFDEIEYSTEFTDEGEDLLYKRVKMQQHRSHQGILEYNEAIENLQREADAWRPQVAEENMEFDERTGRPIPTNAETVLAKFREILDDKKELDETLLNKIAQMKMNKAIRNRNKYNELFG